MSKEKIRKEHGSDLKSNNIMFIILICYKRYCQINNVIQIIALSTYASILLRF